MIIPSNTVPEVIFPKRRNARDMTFANKPIISRNHKKSDIIISPIFTPTLSG